MSKCFLFCQGNSVSCSPHKVAKIEKHWLKQLKHLLVLYMVLLELSGSFEKRECHNFQPWPPSQGHSPKHLEGPLQWMKSPTKLKMNGNSHPFLFINDIKLQTALFSSWPGPLAWKQRTELHCHWGSLWFGVCVQENFFFFCQRAIQVCASVECWSYRRWEQSQIPRHMFCAWRLSCLCFPFWCSFSPKKKKCFKMKILATVNPCGIYLLEGYYCCSLVPYLRNHLWV